MSNTLAIPPRAPSLVSGGDGRGSQSTNASPAFFSSTTLSQNNKTSSSSLEKFYSRVTFMPAASTNKSRGSSMVGTPLGRTREVVDGAASNDASQPVAAMTAEEAAEAEALATLYEAYMAHSEGRNDASSANMPVTEHTNDKARRSTSAKGTRVSFMLDREHNDHDDEAEEESGVRLETRPFIRDDDAPRNSDLSHPIRSSVMGGDKPPPRVSLDRPLKTGSAKERGLLVAPRHLTTNGEKSEEGEEGTGTLFSSAHHPYLLREVARKEAENALYHHHHHAGSLVSAPPLPSSSAPSPIRDYYKEGALAFDGTNNNYVSLSTLYVEVKAPSSQQPFSSTSTATNTAARRGVGDGGHHIPIIVPSSAAKAVIEAQRNASGAASYFHHHHHHSASSSSSSSDYYRYTSSYNDPDLLATTYYHKGRSILMEAMAFAQAPMGEPPKSEQSSAAFVDADGGDVGGVRVGVDGAAHVCQGQFEVTVVKDFAMFELLARQVIVGSACDAFEVYYFDFWQPLRIAAEEERVRTTMLSDCREAAEGKTCSFTLFDSPAIASFPPLQLHQYPAEGFDALLTEAIEPFYRGLLVMAEEAERHHTGLGALRAQRVVTEGDVLFGPLLSPRDVSASPPSILCSTAQHNADANTAAAAPSSLTAAAALDSLASVSRQALFRRLAASSLYKDELTAMERHGVLSLLDDADLCALLRSSEYYERTGMDDEMGEGGGEASAVLVCNNATPPIACLRDVNASVVVEYLVGSASHYGGDPPEGDVAVATCPPSPFMGPSSSTIDYNTAEASHRSHDDHVDVAKNADRKNQQQDDGESEEGPAIPPRPSSDMLPHPPLAQTSAAVGGGGEEQNIALDPSLREEEDAAVRHDYDHTADEETAHGNNAEEEEEDEEDSSAPSDPSPETQVEDPDLEVDSAARRRSHHYRQQKSRPQQRPHTHSTPPAAATATGGEEKGIVKKATEVSREVRAFVVHQPEDGHRYYHHDDDTTTDGNTMSDDNFIEDDEGSASFDSKSVNPPLPSLPAAQQKILHRPQRPPNAFGRSRSVDGAHTTTVTSGDDDNATAAGHHGSHGRKSNESPGGGPRKQKRGHSRGGAGGSGFRRSKYSGNPSRSEDDRSSRGDAGRGRAVDSIDFVQRSYEQRAAWFRYMQSPMDSCTSGGGGEGSAVIDDFVNIRGSRNAAVIPAPPPPRRRSSFVDDSETRDASPLPSPHQPEPVSLPEAVAFASNPRHQILATLSAPSPPLSLAAPQSRTVAGNEGGGVGVGSEDKKSRYAEHLYRQAVARQHWNRVFALIDAEERNRLSIVLAQAAEAETLLHRCAQRCLCRVCSGGGNTSSRRSSRSTARGASVASSLAGDDQCHHHHEHDEDHTEP